MGKYCNNCYNFIMFRNILNKNNSFYDSNIGLVFQNILVTFILNPYYKTFFKLEVHGKENIPKKEALIFAANHCSYHDPPLLATATRMHMAYMAKKELFDMPVLAPIVSALGAFPVNRKKLEIKTIKTAKRVVSSKKWNLGIFPPGTRIMDGTLGEAKPGFSHLAKATKSMVIPVYINLKRGKYPFYGKIIVTIDKPIQASNNADEILEKWKESLSRMSGLKFTDKNSSEKAVV